MTRQKTCAEDK